MADVSVFSPRGAFPWLAELDPPAVFWSLVDSVLAGESELVYAYDRESCEPFGGPGNMITPLRASVISAGGAEFSLDCGLYGRSGPGWLLLGEDNGFISGGECLFVVPSLLG